MPGESKEVNVCFKIDVSAVLHFLLLNIILMKWIPVYSNSFTFNQWSAERAFHNRFTNHQKFDWQTNILSQKEILI